MLTCLKSDERHLKRVPLNTCRDAQSCPTLCDPGGLLPSRLLCPGGFSRQEYWSGLPFPPPGNLPDPGMELESLTSPALAGRLYTMNLTWEAVTVPHIGIQILTFIFPSLLVLSVTSSFLMRSLFGPGVGVGTRRQKHRHVDTDPRKHSRSTVVKPTPYRTPGLRFSPHVG